MKQSTYSGKRPTMWYQDGKIPDSLVSGPRIRIFYPNGKIEWSTLVLLSAFQKNIIDDIFAQYVFDVPSCHSTLGFTSMQEAIEYVNKDDKINHYPPMEFLGEL